MTDGGVIEVALFGSYRLRLGATRGGMRVWLPGATTVADVLRLLEIVVEPGSLIVVNGEAVGPDQVVQAGDRLELFSPMGGGA